MSSPAVSRPLRLVFYQPHAENWFKNPLRMILRGQSLPHKYESFFDALLASDIEIYFSTSKQRVPGWVGLVRYLLDPIVLLLWMRFNRITDARMVLTKEGLRSKDAIFFIHYGSFTHDPPQTVRGLPLARNLADVEILKIAHLTHYAFYPAHGTRNLRQLGIDVLVGENDLQSNSKLYQKHFGPLQAEFWRLPYAAANRFKVVTPFSERTHKLVATGSITYKMTDPDFIAFYGTNELQPLRRQLYERAGEFPAELDSLISDLDATRKYSGPPEPTWRKLLKRWQKHPQSAYYKKNIVDVYNSYTMFVVTEEVCNLPAIGFVEGMACGCAYFGLDDPMYRDLGMVPGVHYIAYDGTVDGLIEKVRHYQHPDQHAELEAIAARGCELVNATLRPDIVNRAFIERLSAKLRSRVA
jgi:hypothetical protein